MPQCRKLCPQEAREPPERLGSPYSHRSESQSAVNILTAMAENERVVKKESDPQRKAIAVAWLFHLVGDIHQPLHTAQLFTIDYPKGDRGGNENLCPGDAGGATDRSTPVLGWGDYLQSESYIATKRSNGTAKPPGVSAEPAHRTCVHRL